MTSRQDDEPLILVGTSEENIVNDSKCDRDAIDALTLLIEADIFPPDNKTKYIKRCTFLCYRYKF